MINREEQEKAKEYAAQMESRLKEDVYSTISTRSDCGAAGQPGIRERVIQQLNRASVEAVKAERLRELSGLLEKYPEVARILDLLEYTRNY